MTRPLLLLCATLMLSLPATAQDEWQFDINFPPDPLVTDGNGLHGVAVDGLGRIWIQPFGNHPDAGALRLHIFNPDGSAAPFSPLSVIAFPAGADVTLKTPRGLATDHQGHIIVSQGNEIVKVNHTTGQGIALANIGTPPTKATVDNEGNVYVGGVLPGQPISIFSAGLEPLGAVRASSPTFSRSHQVSPDGLTFYETNFETTYIIIHTRPDEFTAFDSTGFALRGMRVESTAFHPTTGNLWVSAGNNLNKPNEDTEADRMWFAHTWYEFDPTDFTTPLDSIVWHGCESFTAEGLCLRPGDASPSDATARPRGMAFSHDGLSVYLAGFSSNHLAPGGNSQRHVLAPVSTEPTSQPGLFTLSQNYPNPFSGSTTIDFEIEEPGHVTLRVFDVLGRQVAVLVDGTLSADNHTATLSAGSLATGTYVYTLELNGQLLGSRRMLILN